MRPRVLVHNAFTWRHCNLRHVFSSRLASSDIRRSLASNQRRTYSAGKTWTPLPMPANLATNGHNGLSNSSETTILKDAKAPIQKAYIALGSNLGDRIAYIEKACNEMLSRGIKITRTSSLWETEPMYVLDQANFVNGVCEVSAVFLISLGSLVHIPLTSNGPLVMCKLTDTRWKLPSHPWPF
jgi:hypothetical protein